MPLEIMVRIVLKTFFRRFSVNCLKLLISLCVKLVSMATAVAIEKIRENVSIFSNSFIVGLTISDNESLVEVSVDAFRGHIPY